MNRICVIKTGGELLVSPETRARIFADIARWKKRGPVVLVHGGGPQIEAALSANKIEHRFVNGRRVTSPEAMAVVERTLSGEINKGIAADLQKSGVRAVGLSGRDGAMIQGSVITGLGRAARPSRVDVSLITALTARGFVPVISTVGSDAKGAAVNINADDAASALAKKLRALHLIFLTNVNGVLDRNGKRIPTLRTSQIKPLIQSEVISGGMIPKVEGARAAIQAGVGEVDIVNGRAGVRLDSGTRIMR